MLQVKDLNIQQKNTERQRNSMHQPKSPSTTGETTGPRAKTIYIRRTPLENPGLVGRKGRPKGRRFEGFNTQETGNRNPSAWRSKTRTSNKHGPRTESQTLSRIKKEGSGVGLPKVCNFGGSPPVPGVYIYPAD